LRLSASVFAVRENKLLSNLRFTIPKLKPRVDICVRTLFIPSIIAAMVRDPTREVIGAAMKIHRRLGPGLLESAYEACLSYELQEAGHRVERQKPVPLFHKDVKLDCGFRADIVVDGVLALELKCKEALHPV